MLPRGQRAHLDQSPRCAATLIDRPTEQVDPFLPSSDGTGTTSVLTRLTTLWTSALDLWLPFRLLGLLSACFTRPRFELGLSSRHPQVSCELDRHDPCSRQALTSMRRDAIILGLSRCEALV